MRRRYKQVRGQATRGRKLLIQAMRRGGLSQKDVATRLGLRQTNVSAWCRGLFRPKPHFRLMLEAWLGIPRDAWLSGAELRLLLDELPPTSLAR